MSNQALIAKELAAQEAKNHPPGDAVAERPMVVGHAAVGSQLSPSPAGQVNQAQNTNLAALYAAQAPSILDLPEEVKKNINPHKLEEMELDEILQRLVNSRTHPIDCDRIIQLLWVEFKRSPERAKVQNRLRALSKSGLIVKSDGRSAYERLPSTILNDPAYIKLPAHNNPKKE